MAKKCVSENQNMIKFRIIVRTQFQSFGHVHMIFFGTWL